ncbi:MAG: cysteine--tRNA ligase, partial [Clostridia bacterium]|nr:cysteine--tRNA ligase [Clostridia bacterium]
LLEKEVKMYACGITVSGEAHIGHAIQAITFDIIRKYLEKKGYKVTYARNYTDVDDKIIANANKLNMDAMEFANKNIAIIDESMERLGVDKATLELKATENIDNIIEFVSKLIDKGYAYATEAGDVYFAVDKYAPYGKLSRRKLEDAYSGVRIDSEENKINPLDFALWKSAKPGEIFWKSPWGDGRPGWHIECSAMNYYHLGDEIDIHGGGRDLIFPHHENEIAQTEALTGKPFAKYWLHNGLVKVNGQKMSKSLGNSIFLRELLDKYDNEIIRFALLQTSYKNDINITDNLFDDAKKHLAGFYKILKQVEDMGINDAAKNETIDKEFDEAMDDDFNTAKALANLFGYFKEMSKKVASGDKSVVADYNAIRETYSLLGLFKKDTDTFLSLVKEDEADIPSNVKELAELRWTAKQNKDWANADKYRDELASLGYVIKDSKDGYEIIKK